MFYSIFLIFFALQKYYLMICSCTFTHMVTERTVWKMRRTCTHLRLHHDPYVSRSQHKVKQVPDQWPAEQALAHKTIHACDDILIGLTR